MKLLAFERYARQAAVGKEGFVARLDPAEGEFKIFGQVGCRMGEGIEILVERAEGKAFA